MIAFIALVALLAIVTVAYLQHPKFGSQPDAQSLELIKKSPNYKDGKFQNQSNTPDFAEGVTYYDVFKEFFFSPKFKTKPIDNIPSVRTDLLSLEQENDILVWFGHSSYFMRLDGKNILVDPVFSGNASPIPATMKSFNGSDIYIASQLPHIDYLFLTHDHWDHLDYETVLELNGKVDKIICGLGLASHLRRWKIEAEIFETDWFDTIELEPGFKSVTTPARHFSGRTFKRNTSLWTSFVFNTPSYKIFIGGDSGYDKHFKEIGDKYGPFDLAILENGQYNWKWKYIHTTPEETLQAAEDLRSKMLLPVHSAKFALALHSWDEPLKKISEQTNIYCGKVITPMIGELVHLKDSAHVFKKWWQEIQ